MQYKTDPKSEKNLSVLGFGCMRFPRDAEKTEALIIEAIESGINYFDTAYIYGNSEKILGEILHKNKLREKVNIATKLPFMKCKSREDFDRLFNKQLERLKTDYIDYYLIHNLSELRFWSELCHMGIKEWIAGKKAGGQIGQIGFSFHGSFNEFLALIGAYEWDFCQIQYNYMDENYQAGRKGLQKAHELGLPVIIMEPLLGGKLATGLPPRALKLFKDTNADLSPAAWGFSWLWNQPEVTVVLSGMNSHQQLSENLKTAESARPGMLTEREVSVYTPVIETLREAYKVPCTGCGYCMPCPHNVNIPGCFSSYNTSYAMGFITGIIQYITSSGTRKPEESSGPGRCVKCGACEKKCPQNIEIIKELESVKKRMEPLWFGPVTKLIRAIMG